MTLEEAVEKAYQALLALRIAEMKVGWVRCQERTKLIPDSLSHPAKMDSQLLLWIVEHYTKASEGETSWQMTDR